MAAPIRILIVEDSPTLARIMALALEAEGYAPQTAVDLPAAQAALAQESFSLLIVDDNGRAGWAGQLGKQAPDAPVLVLQSPQEASGSDALVKPFESAALLARVEALVGVPGGKAASTALAKKKSGCALPLAGGLLLFSGIVICLTLL